MKESREMGMRQFVEVYLELSLLTLLCVGYTSVLFAVDRNAIILSGMSKNRGMSTIVAGKTTTRTRSVDSRSDGQASIGGSICCFLPEYQVAKSK